jgi:hypothetical protein
MRGKNLRKRNLIWHSRAIPTKNSIEAMLKGCSKNGCHAVAEGANIPNMIEALHELVEFVQG